MANTKNKGSGKQPAPLPEHFESLEQAAEFWDEHDSADYEEFMQDVEAEGRIRERTYLVRLEGELYRKVIDIARERGVPAESLVNDWVQEKAS